MSGPRRRHHCRLPAAPNHRHRDRWPSTDAARKGQLGPPLAGILSPERARVWAPQQGRSTAAHSREGESARRRMGLRRRRRHSSLWPNVAAAAPFERERKGGRAKESRKECLALCAAMAGLWCHGRLAVARRREAADGSRRSQSERNGGESKVKLGFQRGRMASGFVRP